MKVTDDVLMAFNSEVISMLVNTVGHNILLQRFKHAMGITGIVLQCFEVYIFNRLQFVYLMPLTQKLVMEFHWVLCYEQYSCLLYAI